MLHNLRSGPLFQRLYPGQRQRIMTMEKTIGRPDRVSRASRMSPGQPLHSLRLQNWHVQRTFDATCTLRQFCVLCVLPQLSSLLQLKTRESSSLFSVHHVGLRSIDGAHRCQAQSRCHACVDYDRECHVHGHSLSALHTRRRDRSSATPRDRHSLRASSFWRRWRRQPLRDFAKAVWLWNKLRWTPDVRAASLVKLAGLGMANPCVSAPRAYVSRTAHLTLVMRSLALKILTSQTHR